MSDPRLRVIRTELDNLVSNLRGEVGEIITNWTMLRFLMGEERRLSSNDIAKDMRNQNLAFISILRHKMHDEIVARLSELANAKIGRLTFHFAAAKLKALDAEEESFRRFIECHRFDEKRNYDISHKELPEQWSEHKLISISYKTLLRGVARASALMKKIDRVALGPSAPYLWREMRKKRYEVMYPPSAAYLLVPYLRLSNEVRGKIILEEMAEDREVWSEMETKINGADVKLYVCKKWAGVFLGDRIMCLDQYPLQELSQITFDVPANIEEPPEAVKPILEQKVIKAKYRATEVTDERVVFVPVQKLHLLEQGAVTELCNFTVNFKGKLETRITEIATELVLTAELQHRESAIHRYQWRVKRKAELEEEDRKRKLEAERRERERLKRLEQARIDRLLKDAQAFEQARVIRGYVETIRLKHECSAPSTTECFERWSKWALAQADRIDPSLGDAFLKTMQDQDDGEPMKASSGV